jgi:tetratricopeptide (TPR) repeat protein
MAESLCCPGCGRALPPGAAEGLCPECARRAAESATPRDEAETATAATLDAPTRPTPTRTGADVEEITRDTDPVERLDAGVRVRYFGDYELRAVIARGGMGVVYRARQISLNRPVALKMIRAGTFASDDDVRRFRAEAEAAAQLEHPGIVPIYEVGTHDGHHYFSMRLIEGESLAQHAPRLRRDAKAIARLVAEAARGVHHAHMRGILHRDLKPSNILVDAEGHPHITDFGLARRIDADSGLTRSGAILGTPAYMSPEQARGHGQSVTTASDVYGLGAVLYVLLTGAPPFQGDSVMDTLRRVVETEPARPRSLDPKADRDLETIALKCLEKDPRRRYASADALAEELERFARGELIQARPVGAVERLRKWARRRPLVAGLGAAVVVAVLAGLVGTSLALGLALRREREAVAARNVADRRLDRMMEAISDYYTGVSQEVLLGQPEMQGLRARLLERPRAFYEQLTQELAGAPATDLRARYRLARGRFDLGRILHDLGRYREARAQDEAAVKLLDELAARRPSEPSYRDALARARGNLGSVLYSLGQPRAAAEAYREAIALREAGPIPAATADRAERTERLGHDYDHMAIALHAAGDLPAATRAYRRAIGLQEEATAAAPEARDVRSGLAHSYTNFGNLLSNAGDVAGAAEAQRKAVGLLEALTDAEPGHAARRGELATARDNLGVSLEQLGDYRGAAAMFEAAIQTFAQIVESRPNVPEPRYLLANCRYNLARLRAATGQHADAQALLGQTIAELEALGPSAEKISDYPLRLGAAYTLRGNILGTLHDARGSVEAHEKALALVEDLVARHPESPHFRNALAINCNNLGNARMGVDDLAGAAAMFRRGIALREALVREQPDAPAHRIGLAHIYMNLGNIEQLSGRHAEALDAYRRAIALSEPLIAAQPKVFELREGLAGTKKNLGALLMAMGRPEEALAAFRESIALREALVEEVPDELEIRVRLAGAHANLGVALAELGRPEEGAEAHGRAVAILARLVGAHPERVDLRSRLGGMLNDQAMSLGAAGRHEEAVALYQQALVEQRRAFERAPGMPVVRRSLSNHLGGLAHELRILRRPVEAADATRRRAALWPNDAGELYDAACELALCVPLLDDTARRDALADAAVDVLRRAIAAGWRDASHTARDPDLAALRDRTDFRELLRSLGDRAFPADAFAR